MSDLTRNTIRYSVACVNLFARRKHLTGREAFLYLYQYKGLQFLEEFYDVEHTLSFEDVLDDLEIICRQNGGALA